MQTQSESRTEGGLNGGEESEDPSPQKPVAISKTDLNERFLLQISYEKENGLQDFMNRQSDSAIG